MPDASNTDLKETALQAVRAMHQWGVIHKDVRLANMLFNSETNGVMMVDFERASLLELPQPPLGQPVPNKRRWESEGVDKSSRRQAERGFSEDIYTAETVFHR
ncbi:hypothetical protein ACHAPT_008349 [Fusarium lateritium]